MDLSTKSALGKPWSVLTPECVAPPHHDLHCTHAIIKNARTYTEDDHTACKNSTGSGGVQKVTAQGMQR